MVPPFYGLLTPFLASRFPLPSSPPGFPPFPYYAAGVTRFPPSPPMCLPYGPYYPVLLISPGLPPFAGGCPPTGAYYRLLSSTPSLALYFGLVFASRDLLYAFMGILKLLPPNVGFLLLLMATFFPQLAPPITGEYYKS